MRLAARLLLCLALLCGVLALAGAASAHAGCPHEMERGAQAQVSPHEVTAHVAPVTSTAPEKRPSSHSPAVPRATDHPAVPAHLGHAGGASMPAGPSCCSGSGCLMTCHWVAPALNLATGPNGPGQRLAFSSASDRPAHGPEVQLPPPRDRA
jgi:hypothetical protein